MSGNDILTGGRQNDSLDGGGDDRLIGNNGNDVLQGDGGANSLYGGGGADIFVLENIEGVENVIYDFKDGTDKILLRGSSFFDATIEDSDVGFGTSISISGNPVARVIGVDPSDFSQEDFVA